MVNSQKDKIMKPLKEENKTSADILADLISQDKDPLYPAIIFERDYAGGSKEYVRSSIAISAIERLQNELKKAQEEKEELIKLTENKGRYYI
jgi:hypothetical protein